MSATIFALATPPGRSAIGVVRLCGARSSSVLAAMAGPNVEPRRATVRRLRDPSTGETLDRALVLWFPAPHSYTGEDAVEFHLHGGPAVIEAVSRSLIAQEVRPAEPGEFTRRAFDNQRLDLTEAEGVADLIDARTDAQRRQALRQVEGGLTRVVEGWREDLLDALALLEAAVDFPDEVLPGAIASRAGCPLSRVRRALERAAHDTRGEQVRTGFRVALSGAPNAGKSSLFNALVGRDAAMVSARPGTTRDVVEAPLTLTGHAVVLADTAGIGSSPQDELEEEGMRRAIAWAQSADLRLHIAPTLIGVPGPTAVDWVVLSKADLATADDLDSSPYAVSVLTGAGVNELRAAIGRMASECASDEPSVVTRTRHRELFTRAVEHLVRAEQAVLDARSPELAAEDVRLAARALEQISGRIDAEDVLGRVFSSFCIGK